MNRDVLILVMNKFNGNFTSLGATGRFRPSSLGSYYVEKDNENMATLGNGIQIRTVPYIGTVFLVQVLEMVGLLSQANSTLRKGMLLKY